MQNHIKIKANQKLFEVRVNGDRFVIQASDYEEAEALIEKEFPDSNPEIIEITTSQDSTQ